MCLNNEYVSQSPRYSVVFQAVNLSKAMTLTPPNCTYTLLTGA